MAVQRLDRLDQLAKFLREPAMAFIQAVEKELSITLFVVFTWRSSQEQDRLYQQGRSFQREEGIWVVTDSAKVVTNSFAGRSAHNVVTDAGGPASVAIDVIPMAKDGTLRWDTPRTVWERIWTIAWRYGWDPLGDTVGAYLKTDLGHFEEPAWEYKLKGLGLIQPVSEGPRTTVL